jgi:hypothetical protein
VKFLRRDDTVWSTTTDAAAYLAYLAYPDKSETEKRANFVDAASAWSWKTGFGRKGGRPPKRLQAWDTRRLNGTLNRGLDRIDKRRLPAVSVAYARLRGDSINLTLSTFHLPMEDEFRLGSVVDELRDSGRDNLRRLIWRESRPVLAMAMGLSQQLPWVSDSDPDFPTWRLLLRNDWVEPAIDYAQRHACQLADRFDLPRVIVPRR